MFPLPLVVTVGPQRLLGTALTGLHGLAVAALWLAQLPISLQGACTVALLLSLWHYCKPRAPLGLRCHKDGKLEMKSGGGWILLTLEAPPVLLPWLTVLRYRQSAEKLPDSLVITPDALPAEDFRRLRVWLRWLSPHHQPSPDVQP